MLINKNHIKIKPNKLFGFMYNYDGNNKKYIDNINGTSKKKQYFYEIGQIYESGKNKIYVDKKSIPPQVELYVFDSFELETKFNAEKIKEIYATLTESEKEIKFTRFPIDLKTYITKYVLAPIEQKKKYQKEDREFLLEARSLKQFKFEQKKHSIETRMKIISLMNATLDDENLYILDEEAVREYYTLLDGLPQKFIEKSEIYIKKNMYKILKRNYHFYNHDYMADYTALVNNKYVNEKEIIKFLQKRLFLTVSLCFNEENLGKENTPKYYALLGSYIKRIILNLKCEEFEIFEDKIEKLMQNLKWFEIKEGRYANFGDDDNIKDRHKNSVFGSKHFKNTGYLIYNSPNHTSFKLKYKTLSAIHTHCDDGSFIYSYKGQPIFIDPGAYKYIENDSVRKFVRSYEAHNNVCILGKEKIFASEINKEIRKNAEYKMYPSQDFGKIKIITDNWEKSNNITFSNNWFKDCEIIQNINIISDDKLEFSYKIKSSKKEKIAIDFNLDDSFNDSIINVEKNNIKVIGEKYVLHFIFNKNINFQERKGYKGYKDGEIKNIKKLRFYRLTHELFEELKLQVKIIPIKKEENFQNSIIENIDNKEIEYLYVNNNTDKLTIVFQGASIPIEDIQNILNNKISKENYLKDRKTSYSFYDYFYKLSLNKEIKSDFLYINDNNSYIYGWYLLDKGQFVNSIYTKFFNDFIIKNKYKKENVFAFGSSKGGFGALLYGLCTENIGNVVSLVPQIKLTNFMVNDWRKSIYMDYMLNKKSELIPIVDSILYDINFTTTKVNLYSGKYDTSSKDVSEYIKFLKKKDEINLNAQFSQENKDHKELLYFYLKDATDIIKNHDTITDNIVKL